mgnify:FL=1
MTVKFNAVTEIQFRGTTFSVGDKVMVYGSKVGVIRNFDQLGVLSNGAPRYCGFIDDESGKNIAYAAFTDHRRPSGTTGIIIKVELPTWVPTKPEKI